jgi:competence protein ComEC
MLEMAGASLLFTGDMDAAAEQDLLFMIQDGSLAASFGQYDAEATLADGTAQEMFTRHSGENHKEVPVTIEVLKVAHHGSKTSSTEAWLQYWNASASVISAGANNTYGHPNPGVLERLVDSGTNIYRTDQMGEIQMRIKDGEIDVRYKLEGG